MMKNSFIIVSYLNLQCENNNITNEWMERRLELLNVVTLQSLRGQSDQDFLYVLICAKNTPKTYRQKLRAMMPFNSVICWVTPEMTNYPCKNSDTLTGTAGTILLNKYIQPDKYGMVWTTHIGSDDALGRNFVRDMKASFDFDQFKYHGFLYFPAGYVYFSHRQKFYDVYDAEYFFLTLRESVESFQSVLYTDHVHIHRRAPATRVSSSEPMWIKILHGNQIGSNTYRRSWKKRTVNDNPVGFKRVAKQFDIADLRKVRACNIS